MNGEQTQKNWFQRHKVLTGIIGVFLFIMIVGSLAEDKPSTSTAPNTAAVSQPAEPPVEMTAIALYEEFETNEVATQQKYANKRLQVSGTIDTIGTDILESPYVTLQSRNEFISAVQCMFDKSDAGTLVNLKKNQKVVLVGSAPSKLINVVLKDCQVVTQ